MKKLGKIKTELRILLTTVILTVASSAAVFAEDDGNGIFGDASKKAAEGIQGTLKSGLPWVIMIILMVTGLVLLIGTQRKVEEVKEQAPLKIIGIALILCAGGLATTIFNWF